MPYYEVSNLGRVRSWKRGRYEGRRAEPRLLRQSMSNHGYPWLALGAAHPGQFVHRLVAAAFLGPCPPGQEVRHKDGDPGNARWDNLEYGTHQQNMLDEVISGRWFALKLTPEDVHTIRRLAKQGMPQEEIGRHVGASQSHVSDILTGKQWKHLPAKD